MKRILIIEDDESIADIERDYLTLAGFDVDVTTTGNDGIALGRSGNYDLILLDLMLPGVDGFTVCRKLRETLDIPILMVTARQEDIDKIRGLHNQALLPKRARRAHKGKPRAVRPPEGLRRQEPRADKLR